MSEYNTGNPVPSIDPRDLDDNATIFDKLLNEEVASILDRLGIPRKTWWQMEQDAMALISPNVAALAGLTGAADRLAYFTGPGAMTLATLTSQARALLDDASFAAMLTTLGAAARGANNDITSLAGLTTALSVAQGGTGVTTMANLLTALIAAGAYAKSNILGTVSQTAGVPTGAIIETGSNAQGRFEKFANGTVRINRALNIASGATTAAGAIFRSPATAAGGWPIPLTTLLGVVHSGTDSGGGGWSATDVFPSLSGWGSYSTRNHVSSGTSGTVYLEAIGTWF